MRWLKLLVLLFVSQSHTSRSWLFSSPTPSKDDAEKGQVAVEEREEALLDAGSSVRGVWKQDEAKYVNLKFQCDGHSSAKKELSLERVNDDYCDCLDGTDEPGTSACSGVGDSKFFCVNKLHRGEFIPSSRVFDTLCDCCDGSDEEVGRCEDVCEETGRAFREARAQALSERLKGLEVKKQYIDQAKEKFSQSNEERAREIDAEIVRHNTEKEELNRKVEQAQTTVSAKEKVVEGMLSGARRESLHLKLLDREELEQLIVDLAVESDSGEFLVELVNELLANKQGVQVNVDGTVESANGVAAEWLEKGDLQDDTSNELAVATANLESLENEQQILDTKLSALEKEKADLETPDKEDYGPDNVWWALRNECFTAKVEKYNYSMCPFGQAKQDSTSLGRWKGFEEGSNYATFSFEGGLKCWNGPQRSLKVNLRCGAQNQILSVQEPSTCEYVMEFESPAAC